MRGNRSLRLVFNGYSAPTLTPSIRLLPSKPPRATAGFSRAHRKLEKCGAPQLEIYNVIDNKSLAASETFPVGTNDWRE
jgi:hypothetical protein